MNNGYFLYQQPAPLSEPILGDFAAIGGLSLGTPDIIKLFGTGMVYRMENGYFSYLPPRRIKGVFSSNNSQKFFLSDACEILTPESNKAESSIVMSENANIVEIVYVCVDAIVLDKEAAEQQMVIDCVDSLFLSDNVSGGQNLFFEVTDSIYVGDSSTQTEETHVMVDYITWSDAIPFIEVRNVVNCADSIFVRDNCSLTTQSFAAYERLVSSDKVTNVSGNIVYKIDCVDTIRIYETGVKK